MKIHAKDINQSIDKNIIGTANITKVCSKFNIKLVILGCVSHPGEEDVCMLWLSAFVVVIILYSLVINLSANNIFVLLVNWG